MIYTPECITLFHAYVLIMNAYEYSGVSRILMSQFVDLVCPTDSELLFSHRSFYKKQRVRLECRVSPGGTPLNFGGGVGLGSLKPEPFSEQT